MNRRVSTGSPCAFTMQFYLQADPAAGAGGSPVLGPSTPRSEDGAAATRGGGQTGAATLTGQQVGST